MDSYIDDGSFTGEEYEDPRCQGCSQPIDDGSVVQFGDGIWHFECFRCSKCNELVECYSNLLLLRDGSPICEQCSYNCHLCHKTIKDEAIMTGEEAYHAECFRCVQCHTKIDDLVFTQTSKGIFCTQCHETRKQLRQKRKEEKLRQQQQQELDQSERLMHQGLDQSGLDDYRKNRHNSILPGLDINSSLYSRRIFPSETWNSPTMSRQLSANSILNDYVDGTSNPPTSSFTTQTTQQQSTLSELSTQELIELNKMLNAAIEGDHIPSPPPETRGATTLLKSNSSDDLYNIQQELEHTKAKLYQVENKFGQLKDISRRALDEYKIIKDRINAETTTRQETETKMLKLQNELSFYHHLNIFGPTELAQYSKEELAQLHKVRTQVEQSVNDLRRQRDIILEEIERQKMAQWDRFATAHQQQLVSLQHDTNHAKLGYDRLVKARDDIITEMIMLNTKNAELSSLNNDLSRRMTEREREAIAVMAGTSFLPDDPIAEPTSSSGRQSPDQQLKQLVSPKLTAHRDSFNDAAAVAPPRRFKFRRNRSKRSAGSGGEESGNNDKKDANGDALIGMPYDTNMPVIVEKQEGQLRVGNHLFNHTKFLRPTKCDVCSEKMWRGSELKCQECNIICHTKCVYRTTTCQRKSASDSVNSDGSQKVSMFGQELIKQVQSEDNQVPLVVRKCIEAVEQRGMDYEGIYRKSGGAGQMRLIQQSFEQNEEIDLCDDDQWNDICAVSSVLKQYFRDLPNPLFTVEHHQKWVDAILSNDSKSKEEKFQKLLYVIPAEHLTTLKYLMQHLAKINTRNSENLMTAKNLAVVFGPTLMRHVDENMDLVEMNHKIGCIEFILNHMEIFDAPVPEANKSAPLPIRKKPLPTRHRREASIGLPAPAIPPRENAGFI
ncbi:unnamed protein product [Absidia cylindrospora]